MTFCRQACVHFSSSESNGERRRQCQFICNAIGNPEPSFSWTIDGSNFNKTVHRRVSLSSNGRQLTVTNVSTTDSHHEFRCQANNTVGTVSSNVATLNVQCEYLVLINYKLLMRFPANLIELVITLKFESG